MQEEIKIDEPQGALKFITYMVDNASFNMSAANIKQLYFAINTLEVFLSERKEDKPSKTE
jgi:hypothetical protein